MGDVDNEGKVDQPYLDKEHETARDQRNAGKVNQPFESEVDEHADGETSANLE